MKNLLYLLIILLIASCNSISKEYYVDSSNGSDNNSGHSAKSAWATLEKVNQTEFKPGDKLYFKSGGSWKDNSD